eukprot:CAMPEP_0170544150 /NCGR_PEP_ID=MMETSP0211-20121228/3024_1 /TAXON_ID=311385 /ORGANISM="Pseudokeronopsis sp., Strain OXSARD2" /LENGTH=70 /DNA_ID=CAMNT_0010847733 /DNA_START=827 /DNA_END=1039 /DNA_ORIENTATION=+
MIRAVQEDIEYVRFDPKLILEKYMELNPAEMMTTYFYVDDLEEALSKVEHFCRKLRPDLRVKFDEVTHSI